MSDCEFCARLAQPAGERPWYDFHILDQDDRFVTIPSLGALVPGYVLLVPRAHVFSMARLSPDDRAALAAYERRVSGRLAAAWAAPTLFEHGSCGTPAGTAGACVDHAHWHLVPGRHLPPGAVDGFRPAASFEEIAAGRHPDGYLALRQPSGEWSVRSRGRPQSQYFRRHIAAGLGVPDEWDYLAYPRLDHVRATIATF